MQPSTPLLIRPATVQDLPQIKRLYGAMLTETQHNYDLVASPLNVALAVCAVVVPGIEKGFPVFLALQGEIGVGFLAWCPALAECPKVTAIEQGVYVAPEFRRLGLASEMKQRALAVLKSIGVEQVLMTIFDHNHPSVACARKFGAQAVGKVYVMEV